MATVKAFAFNPFMENTYVVFDETKECIIIDPGCFDAREQQELSDFIFDNHLQPVRLLNTHCHVDHVFGNRYISDKYKLGLEINHNDLELLQRAAEYGAVFGVKAESSPEPSNFLSEKDIIKFGNTTLEIVFTPGHSPGSICFIDKKERFVIAGDVLFNGSIGRTDLPGGDFQTLINSIREKLFVLPDDFIVYSGHGPETSVGKEKKYNPFLN